MNRKHVPPEPPPSHVGRMAQAHNLEAGRSYLAVARPVLRGCWALQAEAVPRTVAERQARAPPVAEMDRADGWLHRPVSPSTQSATTSKEGILRATHTLYNQSGRLGNLGPAGVTAGRSGVCAMTVVALACIVTGFVAGWLLRTIFVMAAISWSQERMQNKVRYWQGEAARARALAEQRFRQLAASAGREPEPSDWPAAGRQLANRRESSSTA